MIDILTVAIKNYFLLFLNPEFMLLMGLVVALIAMQYKRSDSIRADMYGIKTDRMWRDTAVAIFLGIAGGLLGTILIIMAGLPLTGSGMTFFLFLLVAAVLMLISPRFLCFAYAGGLISLANIITGWPQVNIFQILSLVALLHMVEGVLIFFSGHLGAVPTYFRVESDNPVGGFILQKFWPIPLVILAVAYNPVSPEILGNMPGWWPLIKPGVEIGRDYLSYALVFAVAGLGYGDLAIARNPWEKSRLSALFLIVYSMILFVLSVSAQYLWILAPVAAIFSPLGHELVIFIGKKIELAGKPAFVPSQYGMRVLDVVPGLPAWDMGIRSGDVIIRIGGNPVRDQGGLRNALANAPYSLEVEFLSGPEKVYNRSFAFRPINKPMGILPVPSGVNSEAYTEINTTGLLWNKLIPLWKKIKR